MFLVDELKHKPLKSWGKLILIFHTKLSADCYNNHPYKNYRESTCSKYCVSLAPRPPCSENKSLVYGSLLKSKNLFILNEILTEKAIVG